MGVRISWLMLARNSLFARLADFGGNAGLLQLFGLARALGDFRLEHARAPQLFGLLGALDHFRFERDGLALNGVRHHVEGARELRRLIVTDDRGARR